MAQNTALCRVCGKEFVPCSKTSAALGAFNYKEVACSPECGQEYLRRVMEARSPKKAPTDFVTGLLAEDSAPVEEHEDATAETKTVFAKRSAKRTETKDE